MRRELRKDSKEALRNSDSGFDNSEQSSPTNTKADDCRRSLTTVDGHRRWSTIVHDCRRSPTVVDVVDDRRRPSIVVEDRRRSSKIFPNFSTAVHDCGRPLTTVMVHGLRSYAPYGVLSLACEKSVFHDFWPYGHQNNFVYLVGNLTRKLILRSVSR